MVWTKDTSRQDALKYRDGFKNIIGQYTDFSEQNPVISSMNFNKSTFLLDAGCGSGRYLANAVEGQSFVGMDISLEMLKVAKQDLKKGFFVAGKLENLPFKDNVFDEVICVRVLQHIRNQQKAISELSRVCIKGGYVTVLCLNSWTLHCLYKNFRMSKFIKYIENPAKYFLGKKISSLLGLTSWDFAYDNYCSLLELTKMFEKCGLRVVKKTGGTIGSPWLFNYFYSGAILEKHFPWFLKKYFKTCLFIENRLSSVVPFNYLMDKIILKGKKE